MWWCLDERLGGIYGGALERDRMGGLDGALGRGSAACFGDGFVVEENLERRGGREGRPG